MGKKLYLTKDKKAKFFYGYVVVAASFLIMMIMWGTFYTFGIFFKPLLVEFGWTRAMTSSAFSISGLLRAVFVMVMGTLTDRFGPRLVIVTGGLFLGLGYLLMSQISTVWQLYLFYGIVGIGMGGGVVPLVSPVARWFVRKRGIMTGIVFAGMGAGTMIMPPLANWLISRYDWRTSYIIVGTIAVVLITLAAQFLRRDPGQMGQLPNGDGVKEEDSGFKARGFSLREATRTRQFWMLSVMLSCFLFIFYTMIVHITPHVIELGISATTAANILAIIGGLGIAGTLAMGPFADRIGNKSAMIIGFTLTSVALLWLIVARDTWMLYLFAAIYGLANGGLIILISPMIAELFGLRSHGIIFGAISAVGVTGSSIGPVLAGWLFDISGQYTTSFLVTTAVAILGLIMAILLRPISGEGGTNEPRRSA